MPILKRGFPRRFATEDRDAQHQRSSWVRSSLPLRVEPVPLSHAAYRRTPGYRPGRWGTRL